MIRFLPIYKRPVYDLLESDYRPFWCMKNPWTCGFEVQKLLLGTTCWVTWLGFCLLLKLRSETGKNSTVEQWWFHHVKISSCLFLMVGSNINCWTPWLKTNEKCRTKTCAHQNVWLIKGWRKPPKNELTKTKHVKQNTWFVAAPACHPGILYIRLEFGIQSCGSLGGFFCWVNGYEPW